MNFKSFGKQIYPPLMEAVVSLKKILLLWHGLTAAATAVNAVIQKRIHESGLHDDIRDSAKQWNEHKCSRVTLPRKPVTWKSWQNSECF